MSRKRTPGKPFDSRIEKALQQWIAMRRPLQDLAKRVGVGSSTIYNYRDGIVQHPQEEIIERIESVVREYSERDSMLETSSFSLPDAQEALEIINEALTESLGGLGRFTTVAERQQVTNRIFRELSKQSVGRS